MFYPHTRTIFTLEADLIRFDKDFTVVEADNQSDLIIEVFLQPGFGTDGIYNKNIGSKFDVFVYSKNNDLNYEITDIKILTEKYSGDLVSFVKMYYPDNTPLKTPFFKSIRINDFYQSNYLVGFFEIPVKRNDIFTIKMKIKIIRNEISKELELNYKYHVKKRNSLFVLVD
jgi:SpoVK/Ycf46/Vps4 family AAA+-type ATPase